MIAEAIILGVIQGITEFFPVSSTAHLILVPWFFGWKGDVNTLTFDVALHAGTLIALLFCFWKDWVELLIKKQKLLTIIIFASIPAGIAGFFLNDIVEKSLREPFVISVMLVAVGFIMLAAEKTGKYKDMEKVDYLDALTIGVAQATALIPGVSRSGITISAGLFKGLKREASARFSFLISTPIIAGATLLHLKKFLTSQGTYDFQLFGVGLITSSITGLLAIKFLIAFLKKYPLNIFVYYRFILAVVIIAGIWLRG
ncbi:MAG TPA: undecaprenyl-diphosphate phosphatase [Thermodesulfovibrionales bacterium]|nr:undecaprenyl-diphosphate phosphatase [Thermodesulfovibrionales bacterium]